MDVQTARRFFGGQSVRPNFNLPLFCVNGQSSTDGKMIRLLAEFTMIHHLDHLVLTTREKNKCIHFYTNVLGMTLETFGTGRIAFKFGEQKINLHECGKEFLPKAEAPTPGSLDLCFIAEIPLEQVIVRLRQCAVAIEEGPVKRTGANWRELAHHVRVRTRPRQQPN